MRVEIKWIIFLCATAVGSPEDDYEMSQHLGQTKSFYFDVELLKEYEESGQDNWVLSPASIRTALSMVYEGSNGDTTNELAALMRLSSHPSAALRQLHSYQQNLQESSVSNLTTIKSANRILVRKGLGVKGPFRQSIVAEYKGDVVTADYDNPTSVVQEVNSWCKDVTQGHIPELITEDSLSTNSSLIIVNAIYFKSIWQTPFLESSTTKQCFYTVKNECRRVNMMKTTGAFRTGLVPTLNSYVLEMPYKDTRYSMIIVLPVSRRGLTQVARDLPYNQLTGILERLPYHEAIITVPKFNIEHSQSLKKTLTDLGVRTMFGDNADFSRIFGNPTSSRVSDVIHKAKIEVSEVGTTAAASTAVLVETLSQTSEVTFRADHPFFFFILDAQTGFLFEGKYAAPDDMSNQAFQRFGSARPADRFTFRDDQPTPLKTNGVLSESYPPSKHSHTETRHKPTSNAYSGSS